MTFFEYSGARPGRAGDGIVHRIEWRVGSEEGLDFWAARLAGEGVEATRADGAVRFADPEGLEHALLVDDSGEPPLTAAAPDVPPEHALRGFAGVRVYASDPAASAALLRDTLGFAPAGDGAWRVAGDERSGTFAYDPPPGNPGRPRRGHGPPRRLAHASVVRADPCRR